MSDGHHCKRWFELELGCPFDGEDWHSLSYDPDDFNWDEYLEWQGLKVPSIAFTNMGYMVYGSILLDQQKALKTKMTLGGSINVAPFTSSGDYLAMVEAAEIAVATRVASGVTPKGLVAAQTSSTQGSRGYTVGKNAEVIIWATAIALAYGITKGRGPGQGGVVAAARLMPAELAVWMASLTQMGRTSPGIVNETLQLAKNAFGWLTETREVAPWPHERNVYNQNAWADPGLG